MAELVNYTLDKHYVFGSGISKIDKLKIKQIEADTEFSLTATAEENDTYLNQYIDLLIDALNDPDYVVTGTVRYLDDIYVDGDTIYVVNTSGELVDQTLSPQPNLTLQVNTNDMNNIGTITWTEPISPRCP